MTDKGIREEAASIVRELKRVIERERASGRGELLMDGAARATGKRRGAMEARGRSGSLPARTHTATVPESTLTAPAPPPAAAPKSASVERVNLFGEVEVVAPSTRAAATAVEYDDEPLPSHHAPLNPFGLADRAELAALALPVLDQIAAEARACRKCGLCETRANAVPGVGTAAGGIVFVGEAPGADEDRLGEPFVGRAGQLLDKIIEAMDKAQLIPGVPLDRKTVYICNVLKCRPPENRNPLPHEIESCAPYLLRQLDVLKPRIICCLGKFAAELLVGVKGTIGGLRGKVYRYHGAKLIVTYHPAACLRNPNYKRPVWEDMQLLAREYVSN